MQSEFWLGNDHLNRITKKKDYVLRVDMQDTSGNKRYAAYNFFAIASEAQKYKLSLGTFSGKHYQVDSFVVSYLLTNSFNFFYTENYCLIDCFYGRKILQSDWLDFRT